MANLSTALNSSISGLALAGRMTQNISNNVANALTDGFAAREVVATARTAGGVGTGVQVAGLTRSVDLYLLSDRRGAEAEYSLATTRADFYSDIENAIGLPTDETSLANQFAGFEKTLIEASVRPESEVTLGAVLRAAQSITQKFQDVSATVETARTQADRDIASAVDFINSKLEQISELNKPITQKASVTEEGVIQLERRQNLIDELADYLPVRQMPRDNGTVTLFTPGGAILLDSQPAVLGFTPTALVTSSMSLAGGTLSGLTINGQTVRTDADRGPISGGKLAALFDVRDVQAPEIIANLDAAARDLIERFQDPAVDPSLLPGDAGLFTDGGAAFDPLNELGIAERISVNALVDPAQGGATWRLRDGIGAATPGSVGDATLLNSLNDAMTAVRVPSSGPFVSSFTAASLVAEITQGIAVKQTGFESDQSFSASRLETLVSQELATGVDTDEQMQKLLLVEQAYAANARVISTIEELLDLLSRI